MIVNEQILKYQSIIKIMYYISIVVSFLMLIEYIIQGAVTGVWNILGLEANYTLPMMYFCGLFMPLLLGFSLIQNITLKIDCTQIYQCVYVKSDSTTITAKIRILDFSDRLKICVSIIVDVVFAFFSAVCNSAFFSNGYFVIIFARFLGGYFVGHFFCYYQSYFMCYAVT